MSTKTALTFIFLGACCSVIGGQITEHSEDSRVFPFPMEGEGLGSTQAVCTPAGAEGFIAARGHQFVDAKGTVRRFLGINLYGPAQMPTKADAEKTARQLAGWGFNAVRLFPQYTWQFRADKDYAKGPDLDLLDRFDYFFAQLKACGLYATLNLHSARTAGYHFKGFRQTMKENKGLDNFDPTFIRHQKDWCKFIFDHVNPYTGLAYRDEPAVLSWEINNECSLAITWFQWDLWHQLLPPFKAELSRQFSDWAEKKYGTMEKLRAAWAIDMPPCPPLPAAEVWQDANAFARAPWYTEGWTRGGAGPKAYQLDAARGSVLVDAHILRKFALINVPFDGCEPYCVRFRIRSPQAGLVIFKVGQHERPYALQGVQQKITTGPEWKDVTLKGAASVADACNRAQFEFKRKGTYEIAAFTLVRGGTGGLATNESLAAQNIAPISNGSFVRAQDVKDFILDAEDRYWQEMIHYVKDVLKSRQLVCGGTLDYGAEYPQTYGDFLDNHFYYGGLASFPGKPWDRANWYTANRLLVRNLDDGKASQSFAIRVVGKPYTISEVSMMHPVATAADFFPIYLSLAAFQDFAAVHTYTWTHEADHRYGSTKFLDMRNNAKYLAHIPAARNMFARGDVKSGFGAPEKIVYELSRQMERALIAKTGYSRRSNLLDTDPLAMIKAATGLRFTDGVAGASSAVEPSAGVSPRRAKSSTGELVWDATDAARAFYAVDTPRTKFLSQFGPAGTAHAFTDGTVFTLGETMMGWAALSLTETAPHRLLLAATGWSQPTGAVVTEYATKKPIAPADEVKAEDRKISTMTAMGDVPFVCEGVRATVRLPVPAGTRVRVTPLDGNARPLGKAMELVSQDGFVTFALGEQYKTVWYRIDILAPTGCPDFAIDAPRPAADAAVVRAADFGFSSTNDFNGRAINRALAHCRRIKAAKLLLAPGVYNCFDSERGIDLVGMTDFELEGQGATLVFRRPPHRLASNAATTLEANLLVKDTMRCRIGNLTMDWDWARDPLCDLGLIVANHVDPRAGESYFDMTFPDYPKSHPGYGRPLPIQTMTTIDAARSTLTWESPSRLLFGLSEGHFGSKMAWLGPDRIRLWPGVPHPGAYVCPAMDYYYGDAYNRKIAGEVNVGQHYRVFHCYYGKGGVRTHGARHTVLHDIAIVSCFGMPVTVDGGTEYCEFLRVSSVPKKGRCCAGTSDGIHVARSKGHLKFTDCEVAFQNDDGMNFHDCFTIGAPVAARRLHITNARGADYFKAEVGDMIELNRWDFKPLGWKGRLVARVGDDLIFDRDLPPLTGEYFQIYNNSYSSDYIRLVGCTFRDTHFRELLQPSHVTVENCSFVRTGLGFVVCSAHSREFWCEGRGSHDLVFRNCRFEHTNMKSDWSSAEVAEFSTRVKFPRAKPYPRGNDVFTQQLPAGFDRGFFSDILIENCRFVDPVDLLVSADPVKGLIFRNNVIEYTGQRRVRPTSGSFKFGHAEDVTICGNQYRPCAHQKLVPRIIGAADGLSFSDNSIADGSGEGRTLLPAQAVGAPPDFPLVARPSPVWP